MFLASFSYLKKGEKVWNTENVNGILNILKNKPYVLPKKAFLFSINVIFWKSQPLFTKGGCILHYNTYISHYISIVLPFSSSAKVHLLGTLLLIGALSSNYILRIAQIHFCFLHIFEVFNENVTFCLSFSKQQNKG